MRNGVHILADPLKGSLKSKDRRRRVSERRLAEQDGRAVAKRNDLLPELKVVQVPVAELLGPERRLRRFDAADIVEAANSIAALTFTQPLILARDRSILDGELRYEAARWLGLETVPCICLEHLTRAEERGLRIALNRLGQRRSWDVEALRMEFAELIVEEQDISLLGFDNIEIDGIMVDEEPLEDEAPPLPLEEALTRLGDVWIMGDHRLLCGDACNSASYPTLMQAEEAQLLLCDPPYGIKISMIVSTKHREFLQGSGEQTDEEFAGFLKKFMAATLSNIVAGGIMFAFIDWRKIYDLLGAGRELGLELLAMPVWVKSQPAMGSLYRSQYELVAGFKKPGGSHKNRIQLGARGRTRSNCWFAPGAGTMGSQAREMLKEHPTSKPVQLLVDAILDVTDPGDIVLDCFGGSGSTLMAAQKCGRRARLIELDPIYCDVILRRWSAVSDIEPTLEETGESMSRVMARRAVDALEVNHAGHN